MPVASVTFRSELDGTTRKELDQLTAENGEYLLQEHDDDGKHTNIHANSITLTKNEGTGATGNISADGKGPHSFKGPIQAKQWIDLDPTGSTPVEPTWGAPLTSLAGGQAHLGQVGTSAAPGTPVGPGLRLRSQAPNATSDWSILAGTESMLQKPALIIVYQGDSPIGKHTPLLIRANNGVAFEILPQYQTAGIAGVNLGSRAQGYGSNYEGFSEVNARRIDALTAFYERGRPTAIGEWQDYTVAWTGASANPVLGDGFCYGTYMRVGKTCFIQIHIYSANTGTAGAGLWSWSVPFPFSGSAISHGSWQAWIYYGNLGLFYPIYAVNAAFLGGPASALSALPYQSTTPYVSSTSYCQSTVPATWGAECQLFLAGFYQID